jgi:hypothetical protein
MIIIESFVGGKTTGNMTRWCMAILIKRIIKSMRRILRRTLAAIAEPELIRPCGYDSEESC